MRMFRRSLRSVATTNATSQSGGGPRNAGCWPCRLRSMPCSLESGSMNGVCSNCRRFNIKCVGAGEDMPVGKDSQRAAKAIKAWIVDSPNHNHDVPPLDLSYLVPLIITVEAVAAQEAFERHGNPPKSLTNSFDLAMHVAKRAYDSGKFAATLTSIANQAFAACRVLLLCVTPEGAVLPSHPTERDYRNASILTSGLPVLSTILRRTSDLLDIGPLEATSATEQALQIILVGMTELRKSLEEAKEAVDPKHVMEHAKPVLPTAALRNLGTVEEEGVDMDLGPRSHDAGAPGPSASKLTPGTREDETITRELGLSLSSASSDPAVTGPGTVGDGGLRSENDAKPFASSDISRQLVHVQPKLFLEPGKIEKDVSLIELPMKRAFGAIDAIPIPGAKGGISAALYVIKDILGISRNPEMLKRLVEHVEFLITLLEPITKMDRPDLPPGLEDNVWKLNSELNDIASSVKWVSSSAADRRLVPIDPLDLETNFSIFTQSLEGVLHGFEMTQKDDSLNSKNPATLSASDRRDLLTSVAMSLPRAGFARRDSGLKGTAIVRGASHVSPAPQQGYPNYINDDTSRPDWAAALALASLLDDIPILPLTLAGPLIQVLDAVSKVIDAVKTMRYGKGVCTHFIFRVLRFLHRLVGELRGSNVPILDDTVTATRLSAVKTNLMAIRADAIRWSRWNSLHGYLKRDEIKFRLAWHEATLTKSLDMFYVAPSTRGSSLADRAETTVVPGSSTSAYRKEDRVGPLVVSEGTVASIPLTGHLDSQRPENQEVFEERFEEVFKDIGVAVQGRLENMGLQATSTTGPRPATMAVLQTGHDRRVSSLTRQISELIAEVGSILPDISVAADTKARSGKWRAHRPQSGDPTRQLHETMSATLQLLNELNNIAPTKLNAAGLADKMSYLSLNLHDLGLWDVAIEVESTVVTLRRADGDIPDLAGSLDNLSTRLAQFGRREEALKACEEAVSIYRPLATDRQDVFHPHLAHSLDTLSVCLSGFGRHEEALKASEEALNIYRLLAADRPNVFHPDLARSLVNLSPCLSNLGRHEEALKVGGEATSLYRLLAADQPDIFRPDFARSLINLSICVSNLGRHEEALRMIEEAVSIYRTLATDRPNVFYPDLARSLVNLSPCLSNLGHHEDALEAGEEATSLYRLLAADRPNIFRPALAHSLDNLSIRFARFGRREEALKACEEAVSIYRPLVVDRPDVFHPDLAHSLDNLSICLARSGRHEGALKAGEEATGLYRLLAADRPDVFSPALAHSLYNLSIRLAPFDRHTEALEAGEEAVNIYRPLVVDRPDVFRPDLAHSLDNLSIRLMQFGRHEDALKASEETTSLYRLLAADQSDVFRSDLARSLINLSTCVSSLGRHKEALLTIEEAVSIYRSLAAGRPNAFDPDLARSLVNLSPCLSNLGRHEEALRIIEEAVSIYRPLAAEQPDVFYIDLARSLVNLSRCLSNLGRHEEALRMTEEATSLYHPLAAD